MRSRVCLVFLCCGAILRAQAPVTLESRVDSSGGGEAVVTNLTAVPLTAYLIQVFLEPCSPSQRPAVFRAADAALAPDGVPLGPSQSRAESLGAARCNKVVGVSVPARAELRAAIFQDGTSFGEQQWVDALLESRKFELDQIETVLNVLKARRTGSASAEVLADLDARLTASQGAKTLPFPPLLDVRELASRNLAGPSPAPDPIARTISVFERLRAALLEARPSLR
jgi:hypothetical protein